MHITRYYVCLNLYQWYLIYDIGIMFNSQSFTIDWLSLVLNFTVLRNKQEVALTVCSDPSPNRWAPLEFDPGNWCCSDRCESRKWPEQQTNIKFVNKKENNVWRLERVFLIENDFKEECAAFVGRFRWPIDNSSPLKTHKIRQINEQI